MINLKRIIICATACSLIVLSMLFSLTEGLIDVSGEYNVKELLSGGSDDNICIEFSKLLLMPFFVYLFRLRNKISVWEFLLGNVILVIQFVLLLAIESGSMLTTMRCGNVILLLWLLSYISLLVELNSFFVYERISGKRESSMALLQR